MVRNKLIYKDYRVCYRLKWLAPFFSLKMHISEIGIRRIIGQHLQIFCACFAGGETH